MPASSSRLSTEKNDNIIGFSEIKSHIEKDVLQDINYILRGLKKAGLGRVIIVDLTNPNIGIPTVRAIVPGLETFKISKSVIGKRGRRYFTS